MPALRDKNLVFVRIRPSYGQPGERSSSPRVWSTTSVPLEISLRNTAIEGSCATPCQRTGRLANLADLGARGYNEEVFPSHAMGGRRQWGLLDVPPVPWALASLGVARRLASATQELAVDAPFTRGVIESMIGFTALFAA